MCAAERQAKADLLAKQELAKRELSRRRLIHFTQQTMPSYEPGWVHRDIAARLERFSRDIAAKKSPRLMLLVPPRHGKSELASIRLPAWHLGHNPHHEVINCGYNLDLPMIFSKKVRALARDPYYQQLFPNMQLDPETQATEAWMTTQQGGFKAAGVGGGITGKGCFFVDTAIDTPLDTPYYTPTISQIRPGDIVYGYDHSTDRLVHTEVLAVSASRHAIGTGSYAGIRCTADHEIYSPGTGYVRADRCESQSMPVLRRVDVERVEEVQGLPTSPVFADKSEDMSVLSGPEISCGQRLQDVQRRPHGTEHVTVIMRAVWGWICKAARMPVETRSPGGGEPHVLFAGLQSGLAQRTLERAARGMRMVLRAFGKEGSETLLYQKVLRRYAGFASRFIPVRPQLAERQDPHTDAGRQNLYPDRGAQTSGSTPHRPQCGEQLPREPYILIEEGARVLSFSSARSAASLTHLVEQEGYETVYDIQTGTGNFFAGGILVHNCHMLIIDDPLKNMEEADSADRRELIDDWYQSTAYTRLAPGGGILLIETWWNWDDLAGRLQQRGKNDPEADQFEVVMYPALSTSYEYRDETTGAIVRTPEPRYGDDQERYTLLRNIDTALHEERYDTKTLKRMRSNLDPRIWSALYQQEPSPDEGIYFKKEHFHFSDRKPEGEHLCYYTAWDFAIGQKQQNDFTVGATVSQDEYDSLYVHDICQIKADSFDIVENMINVASRYLAVSGGNYAVGVEDGQIWRSIKPMLEKRMEERKVFFSIEVLKPLTDKMARARPLQGRMQQGKVFMPENVSWRSATVTEMLQFPGGVHDDIVDALAWAVRLSMLSAPPRVVEQQSRQKSWRDEFLNINNVGASHMCA